MAPQRVMVTVVGLLRDPAFHVAKCTAEASWAGFKSQLEALLCSPRGDEAKSMDRNVRYLNSGVLLRRQYKQQGLETFTSQPSALKLKFPSKFADPVIQPLVEFAWHEYLQEKKKELRGEVWAYASSVMCFIDGQLLGDEKELLKWSHREWDYRDFKPEALYQAITEDFYSKYLKNSQHVFVYLEIAIEEQPVGRLLFELFSDLCPRTCENFRALCTGGAKSPRDGRELTYKNSLFHRLVKNGWIQGGDIITGKGDGGESIYGPTFEDESFAVRHKGRGVLGMANKGRHSNSSQFYITLQPAPYLDRKYVAFGQLIEGTEVLQRLEVVPTYNERPTVACKIVNCGTFEP